MIANIAIDNVFRPLLPKWLLLTGESNVTTPEYISWQDYARIQQAKYRNVKRTPGDLLLDDYIDKALEQHMTLPDDWTCDPEASRHDSPKKEIQNTSLPPSLASLSLMKENVDCTSTCRSLTTSQTSRSVSSSLSSSLDIGFKRSTIDLDNQNESVLFAAIGKLFRSCKPSER